MRSQVDLPPFHIIAAALHTTTERLVREVTAPQDTAPDWNDFEWAVARAVSVMQGISGLLDRRLKWQGPAGWREFLADQHAHMRARDQQIELLLARLDVALAQAGIAFVPLKGSAIRALRLHHPGERPQGDIDLLLDRADLAAAGRVLEAVGYQPLYSNRHHDVYAPASRLPPAGFGEHADSPIKIELHGHVAEALPVDDVDITATILPANRIPGANAYASFAALVRHAGLHAAGNMRANAMRYFQIYEIAQLAVRMTTADWRELVGQGEARAQGWWLYPPFVMAARYLPGTVPAHWLTALRSLCPRRLRERFEQVSIYEVSWSNLRIPALPGLEWSRSLGHTLRFARSRAWPGRVARDELASARTSESSLMRARWYGASQAERIVRWLFTRPPRVQTLALVGASLAADPHPAQNSPRRRQSFQ